MVEYVLHVNGGSHEVRTEPRKLLLDVLREDLGLRGAHAGCEHGVCGACTVLLNGRTVRSCLMFGVQAAAGQIVTIEGVARNGVLHPLQQEFATHHALQCGFCTPGMILTALEFLEDHPEPSEVDVREALSGNLCRCTGYDSIVDAVLAAARRLRAPRVTPHGAGDDAR
jgi:aerobic carbon-monoxide dehydrogenase small subunit